MKIKQYDRVLLKDGALAYIVEIFDNGKAFLADIDRGSGTETDWVKPEEIKEIVK
jgi:hypothetical protein